MAQLLPDPPPPRGPIWPRARGVEYGRYRSVQDSNLTKLEREGVTVSHALTYRETVYRGDIVAVNITGRIETAAGALLLVDAWLDAHRDQHGRCVVRTVDCNYHARVVDLGRDIVRYDNAHGDLDTLHRHRYDTDGVDRLTEPVDIARMPSLADVVREADFLARYLRGALAP